MRYAFLSALALGLVQFAPGAVAQNTPNAWCAQLTGSGSMECIYASKEQCEEAIKGKGGTCMQNPNRRQ